MKYKIICDTCNEHISTDLESLLYMSFKYNTIINFFNTHRYHRVRCITEFEMRTPFQYADMNIRPMIRYLIQCGIPFELTGVEIGTGEGINSLSILKNLNIKMLYLIDPYESPSSSYERDRMEDAFKSSREALAPYINKIKYMQMKSSDASSHIPDNVDFVYIDGDHRYEVVKEDIRLYYNKLKQGGCIGGDDFSAKYTGVVRAVMEFADKNNLKINGRHQEWWIRKPIEQEN